MLDMSVRATMLLLAACVVVALLRRSSAAARHLVWAVALTGVLVLPALPAVVPSWTVTVPALAIPGLPAVAFPASAPEVATPVVMMAGAGAGVVPTVVTHREGRIHTHAHMRVVQRTTGGPVDVLTVAPTATPSEAAMTAFPSEPVDARAMPGALAIWLIWALGVAAVLMRLALGVWRVRGVVRSSQPVVDPAWTRLLQTVSRRLGVYRTVALYSGPAGTVPVTCGILRPVVIVPADAAAWDDERRTLVLTHEIAHVRRLDVLTHLVGQLAVAVFWFHPLAWIAAARMRMERERACDDLVLAAGVRPSRYAGDLLDLVQTLGGVRVPAVAALAMARRTEIEGRLLAILDGAVTRGPVGARRVATALAVAGVTVAALATVHPVAASPVVSESPGQAANQVILVESAAPAPLPEPVAVPTRSTSPAEHVHRTIVPARKDLVLADIAAAAAGLASDASKRQVLLEITQRYCVSDTLRKAMFTAIATMTSDTERRRVLLAVLGRGSRDAATVAAVLNAAMAMASDNDKAMVLRTAAGVDPLTDPAVRAAFFTATNTLASTSSRTAVLLAVLGEARARASSRDRGTAVARMSIAAATHLASDRDKVRVLRELVRGGWLTDAVVHRDFNVCLSTLHSGITIATKD